MSKLPLSDEHVAIVAAGYARRTDVSVDDILDLVARLRGDSPRPNDPQDATESAAEAPRAAGPVPVMDPEQSVTRNQIFCLCCGKGFKMLKRHLGAEHGMTEEDYRAAFDLPASMPLVAPSYSERKAEYARKAGLGTYARERTTAGRNAS